MNKGEIMYCNAALLELPIFISLYIRTSIYPVEMGYNELYVVVNKNNQKFVFFIRMSIIDLSML